MLPLPPLAAPGIRHLTSLTALTSFTLSSNWYHDDVPEVGAAVLCHAVLHHSVSCHAVLAWGRAGPLLSSNWYHDDVPEVR